MVHYTMAGMGAGTPFCGIAKTPENGEFQHMGYSGHPANLCPVCQAIADAPECTACDEPMLYDAEHGYYCDCK